MDEDKATKKALEKHKYPPSIRLIGVIILGLFLYSLFLLPQYYTASKNLKNGEKYLEQRNYSDAITSFKKVLAALPSSKKAKLSLAIAYFSNDDENDDENGLLYLGDITIEDSDWQELMRVMPSEYQQFFITVNE